MIKQIILKNFQIHKRLTLDLHDYFNCIRGSNNCGKSSIIRAIHWVFENSPRGDWMCRKDKNGKKHTAVVKIVFENNTVVKRVRGKDKNYYAVNGEEYHEIGSEIPVDVLNALDLNRSIADEINTSLQIDGQDNEPFLVSNTSTARARALNVITKTDEIEKAIKEFNKDKRDNNRKVKFNKQKIKECERDIDEIKNKLEQIDVGEIDKYVSVINKIEEKLEKLALILEKLKSYDEIINKYESLSKIYTELYKANESLQTVKVLQIQIEKLILLNNRYEKVRHYKKPKKINFETINSVKDEITKDSEKIIKLNAVKSRFDCQKNKMVNAKNEMKKLSVKLEKYNGTICPICGSKIGDILNHVR